MNAYGNSGQNFTAFKFYFSEGIFLYVYNLFTTTYGGLKNQIFKKYFCLVGSVTGLERVKKAPFGPKH
jgi:hypothetical protein